MATHMFLLEECVRMSLVRSRGNYKIGHVPVILDISSTNKIYFL